MESVVQHGSPLAAYLEDYSTNSPHPSTSSDVTPTSVTSHLQTLLAHLSPHLHLSIPSLSQLADSLPTNMSLLNQLRAAIREAEGAKFLEQFRYILATSPLLAADGAASTFPVEIPGWVKEVGGANGKNQLERLSSGQVLARGLDVHEVAAVPVVACVIAAAVKWAHTAQGWSLARLCFAMVLSWALVTVGYLYIRQQWLEHVRRRAVEIAQQMLSAMTVFDEAGRETLGILNDVEEIAADRDDQKPRLLSLRRCLNKDLGGLLTMLLDMTDDFKRYADHEKEVDKYLEIYEVHEQDISEARFGSQVRESWSSEDEGSGSSPDEEVPSVRDLATLWYRHVTLRRVLLCILLAMPCSGSSPTESKRWGRISECIQSLTSLLTNDASNLRSTLQSLNGAIPSRPSSVASPLRPISESASPGAIPTTPTSRLRPASMNFLLSSQPTNIPPLPTTPFRTLNPITTSLRTALARIAVIKDDANTLSTPSTIPSLSPTSPSTSTHPTDPTLSTALTLLSHFQHLHSDLADLQSLTTAATQSLKDYVDRLSPPSIRRASSLRSTSSLRCPRRPTRVVSLGVPTTINPTISPPSSTNPGNSPASTIPAPQSAMDRNLRRRSTMTNPSQRWSLGSVPDRGLIPGLDPGHRARYRVSLSGVTAVESDFASSSAASDAPSRCVSGGSADGSSVGEVVEWEDVEGEGPREALRRLEGMVEARMLLGEKEEVGKEEEVFEGMAATPADSKYVSVVGMSREERMRKAEEGRKRREVEEGERGVERERMRRERSMVVELEGVIGGRRRG